MMLKAYYPGEYAAGVFDIDWQKVYDRGYRGVIFDIDNTLVPHGDDSTLEVDELFKEIHAAGLRTVLLSNNDSERIERFLKNIDSPYVPDADKPDPAGYLKAVELMGIDKSEALFIGDQTFTDIVGANRAGLDSVLVRYIGWGVEKRIGIKRRLEIIVLKAYSMRKSCKHRLGDIFKEGKRSVLE